MIVTRQWAYAAGREMVNVVVGSACVTPSDASAIVETALATLREAGATDTGLVRSRIWARDRDLRRIGSDARVARLQGDLRAASASFISPERLAPGIDVAIDLTALMQAGEKVVVEYEPRIAPPRFVRAGGLMFLSGNTDLSESFDAQLDNICRNIDASLTIAGARRDRIRLVSAFVHRSLDWTSARQALAARFPVPVTVTTVEGYSAPQKLVEIEVTAEA